MQFKTQRAPSLFSKNLHSRREEEHKDEGQRVKNGLERAPAKNQKSIVRREHRSGYSASIIREGSKDTKF